MCGLDKLNEKWIGKPNFYFRYKRVLLESMMEGSCLNVGCGSHIINGATNIDEGLPNLPYPDDSFDTVICSDVIEHLDLPNAAIDDLFRVAKKKVIITVPAHMWLYGKYDGMVGHKRRYVTSDFNGFEITYLFWFLIPLIFMRKVFNLKHRPLHRVIDNFLFKLSKIHLKFGTTILAVKYKR